MTRTRLRSRGWRWFTQYHCAEQVAEWQSRERIWWAGGVLVLRELCMRLCKWLEMKIPLTILVISLNVYFPEVAMLAEVATRWCAWGSVNAPQMCIWRHFEPNMNIEASWHFDDTTGAVWRHVVYFLLFYYNCIGNSAATKFTSETPEVFYGLKHFTHPSIGIAVRRL